MTQDSRSISISPLNSLHIQQAKDSTFRLGNHFLKKHKQMQAGRETRLYIAQLNDTKIVGAFWMEIQPTYCWIRNVFVESCHRHLGIGTKLLRYAIKENKNMSYYCFNTPSLHPFYQSIGFDEVLADELPNSLKTRLLRYQANGKNLIAMRFTTSLS
ncbi:N-acetyltransferase [Hydrogenovibrio crunogenus]|uniref:N-acetyltransferase n=1 Tax=Hydrogenovibrio crunogenus TaxID=39765 RepID=A0A4V1C8S1_9GAMM|nr:GNAT family N-acetyltransferase [Hydrogenovibrio crunogenus]QBZ82884.1 N-acetyltransferase [Hydrogenovibrio crunogenus]